MAALELREASWRAGWRRKLFLVGCRCRRRRLFGLAQVGGHGNAHAAGGFSGARVGLMRLARGLACWSAGRAPPSGRPRLARAISPAEGRAPVLGPQTTSAPSAKNKHSPPLPAFRSSRLASPERADYPPPASERTISGPPPPPPTELGRRAGSLIHTPRPTSGTHSTSGAEWNQLRATACSLAGWRARFT